MKKQSLLWKITHKKAKGPSYLLGTMHVKDSRAFGDLEGIQELILSCEAFATEFDLETADPEQAAAAFSLPDGVTFHDIMSPKKMARLERFLLKRFRIPLSQFINNQPIVLTNFLTTLALQQDQQQSLDETLYAFAKAQNRAILGLETFEEQLAVMKKMSVESQVKQLISLTKNFNKYGKSLNKLAEMYSRGDIQQLYKSSKKSLGKMKKPMIYDRNIIMADRFEAIVAEQTLFCGIGAGHLAGKKGVLKLLKDKGFKVKPVR